MFVDLKQLPKPKRPDGEALGELAQWLI